MLAAGAVALVVLTGAVVWLTGGGGTATGSSDGDGDDGPPAEVPPEHVVTPAEAPELTEVWRLDDRLGVSGTPTVRDDTVYFGTWKGTAVALDVATGEIVWETQVTPREMASAALVTDDRVYLADHDGNLNALDRGTGEVVWTRVLDEHPDANMYSSPVLAPGPDPEGPGTIVIGVSSSELRRPLDDFVFRGSVVGLDAETGDELWRLVVAPGDYGAGVSVWSSAAIDEDLGLAYIGTGQAYENEASPLSDSLLAIDYRTGELAWSRQYTADDVWTYFSPGPNGVDADIGATPTLFTAGERDLVGAGDKAGTFAAFDRATGESVWGTELTEGSPLGGVMVTAAYGEPGSGGPGDDEGVIYLTSNVMDPAGLTDVAAGSHTSTAFALDAATGEVLWEASLPGATFGSLTLADGVLYRPSVPGPLFALDAATGEELWSGAPGGNMGAGVRVHEGTVLAPHGFSFFGTDALDMGGVVAYRVPGS
jgi:polyvinyl alcohol dehydrogenase (cytochrome)